MRTGWALKVNGRIRDVSLVKRPEWKGLPTIANHRREIVPILINEIATCGCGIDIETDVGVTCAAHTKRSVQGRKR